MSRPASTRALHKQLSEAPPPSPEEEKQLLRAALAGDAAAEAELVRKNMRLVADLANRYHSSGASYEDFVQEGTIGLLKAARKFDLSRGFRFSTYATHWIRQALTRFGMGPTRVIRIPEMVRVRIARLMREIETLSASLGRPASPEELAEVLGDEPAEIARLMNLSSEAVSLDTLVGADEDLPLSGSLADEDSACPEDAAVRTSEHAALHGAIRRLSPEHRKILTLRFGLDDGDARSYARIGRELGCSRERVRQQTSLALSQLRERLQNPEDLPGSFEGRIRGPGSGRLRSLPSPPNTGDSRPPGERERQEHSA